MTPADFRLPTEPAAALARSLPSAPSGQSPSPSRSRHALLLPPPHDHPDALQMSSSLPAISRCERVSAFQSTPPPGSPPSQDASPPTSAIPLARSGRRYSRTADPSCARALHSRDYSVPLRAARSRTFVPATPPVAPVHTEESARATPRTAALIRDRSLERTRSRHPFPP